MFIKLTIIDGRKKKSRKFNVDYIEHYEDHYVSFDGRYYEIEETEDEIDRKILTEKKKENFDLIMTLVDIREVLKNLR
ncbi:MAG: hypothetical protein SPL29_06240 [Bacteroidales bacterium]|nr:hypothetical protein [Bacteroidales bacterium]